MAFETVTSNALVGSMSPEQMSLAINGGGIHYATGASSSDSLGPLRALVPAKTAKIIARADDGYGSGESLVLSLRYMTAAGVTVNVTGITLDATTLAAAGEIESGNLDVDGLLVGDVVELVSVYTAGTPNNPEVSVAVQFK